MQFLLCNICSYYIFYLTVSLSSVNTLSVFHTLGKFRLHANKYPTVLCVCVCKQYYANQLLVYSIDCTNRKKLATMNKWRKVRPSVMMRSLLTNWLDKQQTKRSSQEGGAGSIRKYLSNAFDANDQINICDQQRMAAAPGVVREKPISKPPDRQTNAFVDKIACVSLCSVHALHCRIHHMLLTRRLSVVLS